jgi:lysine 2,3-aminomutase
VMDDSNRPTLRSPAALAAEGLIDPASRAGIERVAARYAIAITPDVLDAIDRADPADPVARQYVPDARELDTTPEEHADPIGDDSHAPVKGIVHRYSDRALLKPTHATLDPAELDAALAYIRDTPAIREVILTGGDPLILSPRRLRDLVERLSAIDHVDWLRVHSRVPVADAGRVTPELIDALKAGKTIWVAVHVNHARELTPAALAACALLVDAGIPLVSQTVLLKGVNDDADTLDALFRALVKNRIKPYYLHHGDLAPGTSHFRTTLDDGRVLMRELRGRLSGLAQPAYVLDIPGGAGKIPAGPDWFDADGRPVSPLKT